MTVSSQAVTPGLLVLARQVVLCLVISVVISPDDLWLALIVTDQSGSGREVHTHWKPPNTGAAFRSQEHAAHMPANPPC